MIACQLHWYFLLYALKSGLGLDSVHLCDFFSWKVIKLFIWWQSTGNLLWVGSCRELSLICWIKIQQVFCLLKGVWRSRYLSLGRISPGCEFVLHFYTLIGCFSINDTCELKGWTTYLLEDQSQTVQLHSSKKLHQIAQLNFQCWGCKNWMCFIVPPPFKQTTCVKVFFLPFLLSGIR